MAGDRDFARIYADPLLAPEEKIRRLQAADMTAEVSLPPPPNRLALAPTLGAAQAGGETRADFPTNADVVRGLGLNAPPSEAHAPRVLPPMAPGLDEAMRRARASEYAPSPAAEEEGYARAKTAYDTAPRDPVPTDGLELAEDPGDPLDLPSAYDRSLDRIGLLGGPGGVAAKPMESIHEEKAAEQGSLTPQQLAEAGGALERRDAATVEQARQQAELDRRAGAVTLDARERALAEQHALERAQQAVYEQTKALRDRQDAISEEIIAAPVAEQGLYVGKNFGEKLLTGLSVILYGLGVNGLGRPDLALEQIRMLSNREVDKQTRWLEAKKMQGNALGSIIERHYANYADLEMAKKATQADLLAKAELEVGKLAQEAGVGLDTAKLQALQEGLHADRLKILGEMTKAYGDNVKSAITRTFARERQDQPAYDTPITPNERNPVKPPGPLELATSPDEGTPKTPAPTLGGLGLAETPDGKSAPKPIVGGARPAKPAEAKKPEAVADAIKLWEAGRYEEAFSALPKQTRDNILALRDRYVKSEKMSPKGALSRAFATLTGLNAPKGYVQEGDNPRAVRYGGRILYAADDVTKRAVQPKLEAESALQDGYRQLQRYAETGSSFSAADKRKIATIADNLAPMLSNNVGSGAMSETEKVIYRAAVGGDLGDWLVKPGALAAIQGSMQVSHIRANAILRTLTTDPQGQRPWRPGKAD